MSPVYVPPTFSQRITGNVVANRIAIFILLAIGFLFSLVKVGKELKDRNAKKATKWAFCAVVLLLIGVFLIWYIMSQNKKRDKAIGLSKLSPEQLLQRSLTNAIVQESTLIGRADNYFFLEDKGILMDDMKTIIPKGTTVYGKTIQVRVHPESRYSNPPRLQETIEFTYEGMKYRTTTDGLLSDTQRTNQLR